MKIIEYDSSMDKLFILQWKLNNYFKSTDNLFQFDLAKLLFLRIKKQTKSLIKIDFVNKYDVYLK